MKNVKVSKAELVAKVQENRDAHRAIFEEALEGYRETAVRLLEQHLASVRAGKVRQVMVHLPMPEDHTKDYDRVLAMLEMSVDDEIELDSNSFSSYVQDDWQWKRQFLTSNSAYSVGATAALGEYDG